MQGAKQIVPARKIFAGQWETEKETALTLKKQKVPQSKPEWLAGPAL